LSHRRWGDVVVLFECVGVPRHCRQTLQWEIFWQILHKIVDVIKHWHKPVIVCVYFRHEVLVDVRTSTKIAFALNLSLLALLGKNVELMVLTI